ncbi:MAG: hypothetical protein KGI50_07350, partial [Patescibacteria group bacterium]|nr:hypothetical protein [Patescibacteria group bacterium]
EVYKEYVLALKRDVAVENGADESDTLPQTPEERERVGWSVFHSDENGLFMFDYKIRGFLKEAASSITGKNGLTAFKSKIDKWLFVKPRRLYFLDPKGNNILKPDGVEERPLRAMTAQGPRVSLKRSDYLNAGTQVDFTLVVLPLGQKELTEDLIRSWFEYGQFQGLGEWRNGSYGRFLFELVKAVV